MLLRKRTPMKSGFDRLAPLYDPLLLVFGGAVPRSQRALLDELPQCRRALIIGGGTGRFLVDLVTAGKADHIVCVDISAAMLERSRARLQKVCPDAVGRCTFIHGTAADLAGDEHFDLVCTHCFLDLFEESELAIVMKRLSQALAPGGFWMCSDFAPPGGGAARRLITAALLRGLYIGFGLVCGTVPRSLPPIRETFDALGFRALRVEESGLLWSGLYDKEDVA